MPISKIKQSGLDASALTGSNISDGTITSDDLATNIDIAGTLDVTGTLTADSNITAGSTVTSVGGMTSSAASGGNTILATNSGTTSADFSVLQGNAGSYYNQMFLYGSGESYFQTSGTSLTFGTTSNTPVYMKTNNTNRMIIDNAGYVTKPAQPSFSYTSNAAYAISTTTQEKFTSGNVFSAGVPAGFSHNTGGHFDASTGTFTAPVSGRYKFHASTTLYNFNSGYFYIYIYLNNGGSAYKQFSQQAGVMAQGVIDIILDLSANDYVDARWINNYATPTIIYTTFSGYLLA